jgi:hypothetical protein
VAALMRRNRGKSPGLPEVVGPQTGLPTSPWPPEPTGRSSLHQGFGTYGDPRCSAQTDYRRVEMPSGESASELATRAVAPGPNTMFTAPWAIATGQTLPVMSHR